MGEASSYRRQIYAEVLPEQTKSPYCKMAKGQKNLVSWNAYYHCVSPTPRPAQASARARPNYYPGYAPSSAYTYNYVAPTAAVGVAGGNVVWCEANFRSYKPATGTYLGYDGLYHPCP